jgi:hypothetical protein
MDNSTATPAGLRQAIDSGKTADKVPGLDPAAAPLGTDAEAGGATASPDLIAADAHLESQAPPPRSAPNAANPELAPDGAGARTSYSVPILIGVALGLVLAALLWVFVRTGG